MKNLDGQRLVAESGLDYFKAASTLGALSDEAICFLLREGKVIELDPGEHLFESGQPGNSFFIVLSGRLKYYWERDAADVLIRDVNFGGQIGYVSMIGLQTREGIATASEPTTVIEISADLFYQLHLEYPSDFGIMMLNLSRDMSRVIRHLSGSLAELTCGTVTA